MAQRRNSKYRRIEDTFAMRLLNYCLPFEFASYFSYALKYSK